jgi:hypothetical protein
MEWVSEIRRDFPPFLWPMDREVSRSLTMLTSEMLSKLAITTSMSRRSGCPVCKNKKEIQ